VNDASLDKPLLCLFTDRDVEPNQELCFSYTGLIDDDDSLDDAPSASQVEVSVKQGEDDAVYGICRCGAKRCRGKVFA
jgi:[histone H3]-lysine9 N-trimethyltransferase SUV39H